MKTFRIRTLGCKVNQCDSQEIREKLLEWGWQESGDNVESDVCVINTCCVTRRADAKSRQAIREAVSKSPAASVVVTGCYAGYDRSVVERIAGVEAVFSNREKEKLSLWMREKGVFQGASCAPLSFSGRTRAFVKIQDGCDNQCSFCVVPSVRGSSRSKSVSEIMVQVRRFVGAGHKEIVLTGVCLGGFGRDLSPRSCLVDLIERIEKIDGLERIRLSSIEAEDVSDGLLEKMAAGGKLCPHLHIPFQSGDDTVLRDMNKKMTSGDYRELVQRAREKVERLAITTDMIVGFPTEGEEAAGNSLEFLRFVEPLKVHIFPFSPRQGTFACGPRNSSVSSAVNSMRELTRECRNKFAGRFINKDVTVLFEEGRENLWHGYSENYLRVFVESGVSLRNTSSKVRLTRIEADEIKGNLLS